MRKESKTMVAASRVASVAAVWLATRLLETQKGREMSRQIDRRVDRMTSAAADSIASASRNARMHSGRAAAGLAAIALGGLLLATAVRD